MGSERYQPNEALRRQRQLRGWSQQKVANLLETNEMMVGRWERGERKTSPFYQEKLCDIFGMTAEELGFMSEPQTTKKEKEVQTNAGRENGTEQSSFSLQKQSSEPSISIEEFLLQCTSSTKACWHLLREKGLATAGEILATMIPPLMKLIVQPSKYQQVAACLATEAYLIRAIVAKHQLNFIAREVSCYEAVRCSRLANDPILHAAALMYLGYTHIFVPTPRPKQAVETFLEAVQVLGNAAPLLKSDICMGLANVRIHTHTYSNRLKGCGSEDC